jgi:hypothetical protein
MQVKASVLKLSYFPENELNILVRRHLSSMIALVVSYEQQTKLESNQRISFQTATAYANKHFSMIQLNLSYINFCPI